MAFHYSKVGCQHPFHRPPSLTWPAPCSVPRHLSPPLAVPALTLPSVVWGTLPLPTTAHLPCLEDSTWSQLHELPYFAIDKRFPSHLSYVGVGHGLVISHPSSRYTCCNSVATMMMDIAVKDIGLHLMGCVDLMPKLISPPRGRGLLLWNRYLCLCLLMNCQDRKGNTEKVPGRACCGGQIPTSTLLHWHLRKIVGLLS